MCVRGGGGGGGGEGGAGVALWEEAAPKTDFYRTQSSSMIHVTSSASRS